MVADAHARHVSGDRALHLLQGSPISAASDRAKLEFASSPVGRAVAQFVQWEQTVLGEWKAGLIQEAAGPEYNADQACEELHMLVNSAPVVVFSFSDCPWCVAAKALLAEYGLQKVLRQETAGTDTNAVGDENGQVQLALHEIDKMGKRGKRIRAALATVTGRTSMPNVFISGRSVGGFTDGYATEREGSDRIDGSIFVQSDAIPIQAILSSEEASSLANIGKWTWRRSAGLESLHNSGDLRVMLQKARAIMHTTRRAS
eukprot:scaffold48223_cov31-Tisochrysis_lutea.AAC.2